MKNKTWIYISIIVLITTALFIWDKTRHKEPPVDISTKTSREVALTCTTDMATEFHIHPELHIFVDGEEIKVPNETGIRPDCMYSIHTHKDWPKLHVEAPVQKDFTLGDFFAVWDKDFSATKLLENTVSESTEILVTVNGAQVDTYENTVMHDKDEIVISLQKK